MGTLRASNNAWGLLSTSISNSITTVTLQSGQGARFPAIVAGSGDWFYITAMDSSNNLEIMKVTATSGDQFTVVRGVDNSTALPFAASARVEARIVAAVLNDVMAAIQSVTTAQQADAVAITALSASLTNLSNTVTANNTAQTAALAARLPAGMIAKWNGTVATIPAGWALCNGANGTPDLRDRFIVGAGNSYTPGNLGGAATVALAIANLPAHNHGVADPGHAHSVYDPGHNHGFNDPGHNHYVNDPGHGHHLNDPGHAHGIPPGGWGQAGQDNGGGSFISGANGWGNYTGGINGTYGAATNMSMNNSGTGIWLNAAATNCYNSASPTYVSIYASGTGISTTNTGSGAAIENRPPYYALCYIMKL
jgi:hypothetical protein